MRKKFCSLMLTVVMLLFGVVGLSGCGVGLEEYKMTKQTELQAYADAKNEDDYSLSGWATICDAVTAGKAAIQAAKSKLAVDKALKDATVVLDVVEEEVKVVVQIRKDYLNTLADKSITLKSIYIFKHYGTYDGSHLVIMAIHGFDPPPSIDEVIIEGFKFYFNTGRHIIVWKEGKFFSLQTAYDEGLLTLANIETIFQLYNIKYTINGVFNHTISCNNCTAAIVENHSWVPYGTTQARCPTCKLIANLVDIPVINRIPVEIQDLLIAAAAENSGYAQLHLADGFELCYINGQFCIITEADGFTADAQEEFFSTLDWFYRIME